MKIITEIYRKLPREVSIQYTVKDNSDLITEETNDCCNWKEEAKAKELLPKPVRPWETLTPEVEVEVEKKTKKGRGKNKVKLAKTDFMDFEDVGSSKKVSKKTSVNKVSNKVPKKGRGKKPSGAVLDVAGLDFNDKKKLIVTSLEKFLERKLPVSVTFKKVSLRKPEDSCPDGYRVMCQVGKEIIYEALGKFSMLRVKKALGLK